MPLHSLAVPRVAREAVVPHPPRAWLGGMLAACLGLTLCLPLPAPAAAVEKTREHAIKQKAGSTRRPPARRPAPETDALALLADPPPTRQHPGPAPRKTGRPKPSKASAAGQVRPTQGLPDRHPAPRRPAVQAAAAHKDRPSSLKAPARRVVSPALTSNRPPVQHPAPVKRAPIRSLAPRPRAVDPVVIEELAWQSFGLVLQTSGPFEPAISVLSHPHRFVIDLPAADFGDTNLKRTLTVQRGGVKQVRMSKQGEGVRVVLDCESAPNFQVMQVRERAVLIVAQAGQEDPALAQTLARFAQASGGNEGEEGQELQGIWSRESDTQLTLHVGLRNGEKLRYQVSQPAPDRLRLRVPGGAFEDKLPPPGRLLKQIEASRQGGVWTLDVSLAEGHYELAERRDEQGGITLVWERLNPRSRPDMPLVVIDPGHGGADPGAIGPTGLAEKTVCLEMGKALGEALKRRGYNVILTRSTDADVLLAPRLQAIDRHQADLFISLHTNSHVSREANGLETYWRESGSRGFAETVHRTVATLLRRPDRGTKQDGLFVLRHAVVPSLLLEAGFISNPAEERLLHDGGFQAQAAFAIAVGIENFRVAPLTWLGPAFRIPVCPTVASLACGSEKR
ncbi:MAG: N-acetylmuramoyl-L-alanine amidase [Candidatus Sericytochromatia bacterium]|nr:N-acetylmuramoyl-L-alanine amidase [Candidatus Sericytochromatia bacterium]